MTTLPATDKPKKPICDIRGAFVVRVTDNPSKRALFNLVKFHCSHVRNMVLILRNVLYEAQKQDTTLSPVYKAFIKNDVLRDTVYGRAGKKSAEQIELLRTYYADEPLFNALSQHCQAHLDPKTFYSILTAIKSSYAQFFTNIEAYTANPTAYAAKMGNSGLPKPPKAKRINQICNAGLMLDGEKWSFKTESKVRRGVTVKHHALSLKIGAGERINVPVNPTHFPVPKGQVLRSLNINVSNDAFYLNFTYGVMVQPGDAPSLTSEQSKPTRKHLFAGMDVGLDKLLTLFVDDEQSKSVLVCGKKYKHYNVQFNKHKSRLDEAISRCVTERKDINRDFIDKNGVRIQDTITVPVKYSDAGIALRRTRTHLIECRNRFFDAEFDKLSRRVVDYLLQAGVTDLSLSRNLSFLKTNDAETSQLRKSTKQQFFHLPFGRLLNHISRKCQLVGITVHDIDEAYTSRFSCFSANVNDAKALRQTRGTSLKTTDGKGRRVKRGLFCDEVLGLTYHADINGAVNHIKVANPKYAPTPLLCYKHKFCNPVTITGDREFIRLSRRVSQSVLPSKVSPLQSQDLAQGKVFKTGHESMTNGSTYYFQTCDQV